MSVLGKGDVAESESFYDSGPVESLNAPPPPPPPPPSATPVPRKAPGDTDSWMRRMLDEIARHPPPGGLVPAPVLEAAAATAKQLAELRTWLERLDGEVKALQAARAPAPPGVVPLASPAELAPEPLAVEDAKLLAELHSLRAELERTRADLDRARAEPKALPGGGPEVAALKEQLASSDKALQALRGEIQHQTEENERLEGELQSLKLQAGDARKKTQAAVAAVTDLDLDPKNEEVVQQIVIDRDRLQEEKAAVDRELARLKSEATKRLAALKGDLEKANKLHETVRLQKDNLMRQLQQRDAAGLGEAKEITLEDITNSEVFKQMLGNIRRTSRVEVTTIHEAVASIRAIDPKAYEVVLEVIAKAFQKAQVENPLATLPRGSVPT